MNAKQKEIINEVITKRNLKKRAGKYKFKSADITDLLNVYFDKQSKPIRRLIERFSEHCDKVGWPSERMKEQTNNILK